jgi:hypothetical protein
MPSIVFWLRRKLDFLVLFERNWKVQIIAGESRVLLALYNCLLFSCKWLKHQGDLTKKEKEGNVFFFFSFDIK